jgi:hypothetical protein
LGDLEEALFPFLDWPETANTPEANIPVVTRDDVRERRDELSHHECDIK